MSTRRSTKLDRLHTQQLVEELFDGDLHARRVLSLANGVTGVLRAATLSVHAIGEGYFPIGRLRNPKPLLANNKPGGDSPDDITAHYAP
jgi:hypothetical protein